MASGSRLLDSEVFDGRNPSFELHRGRLKVPLNFGRGDVTVMPLRHSGVFVSSQACNDLEWHAKSGEIAGE